MLNQITVTGLKESSDTVSAKSNSFIKYIFSKAGLTDGLMTLFKSYRHTMTGEPRTVQCMMGIYAWLVTHQ